MMPTVSTSPHWPVPHDALYDDPGRELSYVAATDMTGGGPI
jgi:hypothetical protein